MAKKKKKIPLMVWVFGGIGAAAAFRGLYRPPGADPRDSRAWTFTRRSLEPEDKAWLLAEVLPACGGYPIVAAVEEVVVAAVVRIDAWERVVDKLLFPGMDFRHQEQKAPPPGSQQTVR